MKLLLSFLVFTVPAFTQQLQRSNFPVPGFFSGVDMAGDHVLVTGAAGEMLCGVYNEVLSLQQLNAEVTGFGLQEKRMVVASSGVIHFSKDGGDSWIAWEVPGRSGIKRFVFEDDLIWGFRADGSVLVLNDSGDIIRDYASPLGTKRRKPGEFLNDSIVLKGKPWVLFQNGTVYRRSFGKWRVQKTGDAEIKALLQLDTKRKPLFLNAAGEILKKRWFGGFKLERKLEGLPYAWRFFRSGENGLLLETFGDRRKDPKFRKKLTKHKPEMMPLVLSDGEWKTLPAMELPFFPMDVAYSYHQGKLAVVVVGPQAFGTLIYDAERDRWNRVRFDMKELKLNSSEKQ